MPTGAALPSHLMNLVSAAVAPVVLISATAILLSGYTNKQANVAGQMRSLAAEFRLEHTPEARRASIRQQLALFQRREIAIWATTLALSLSLLCFLNTIFSVMLVEHFQRLATSGAVSLVAGLTVMLLGIVIELHEIYLARLTMQVEIADVSGPVSSAS